MTCDCAERNKTSRMLGSTLVYYCPKCTPETPLSTSKKFDEGKPPLSLVPPKSLVEVAKAFGYGAKKYGQFNYLAGGFKSHRLADAAFRHLNSYLQGEDIDAESGNTHLSHAIAAIMMLLENHLEGTIVDDRYPTSVGKKDIGGPNEPT